MDERADDRVRQLERRGRLDPPRFEPIEHVPRVLEHDLDWHLDGNRTMGRHEIVTADELVELHEVDVAGLSRLGRVEDDEQVIRVSVDLRQVAALQDIPNGQCVEAEAVGQVLGHRLVTRPDIDPDEAVVALEKRRYVGPFARPDPGWRDPANVHRRG